MSDHILVVTDGCSNQGEDPATAAGRARAVGITVSALGIRDDAAGPGGVVQELRAIARAGGGYWDLTEGRRLGRSLSQVLEKAARRRAVRMALVLDCSISMRGRMELLVAGVKEFLDALERNRPGSRVALVAFPTPTGSAQLLTFFTADRPRLEEVLGTLQAQGGTPTGPALGLAVALFGTE